MLFIICFQGVPRVRKKKKEKERATDTRKHSSLSAGFIQTGKRGTRERGKKKKECLPHPNPLKITVLAVGRRVDEPFAEGNKEALEALALENVLGN